MSQDIITESPEQQGWNKNKELCMDVGKGFNVEHYATCVANELLWALEGLVEN